MAAKVCSKLISPNILQFNTPKTHGIGFFNFPPSSCSFKLSSANHYQRRSNFTISASSISLSSSSSSSVETQLRQFDPKLPREEARTPPSSWYTDQSFYDFELEHLFYTSWQVVGYIEQVKEARQYFTGRLGNVEYVVCRDDNGELRGFHNVCRHHASIIAFESGEKSCFVCPYHGWTYGLDGELLKITCNSRIQNLKQNEMGLIPLQVATWGPFVLLKVENGGSTDKSDSNSIELDWIGNSSDMVVSGGVDPSLSFVSRREYIIDCNWKVFSDNYLDGGYHIQYLHKGFASHLKLESYSIEVHEKVSMQACGCDDLEAGQDFDRLGSKAVYFYIYPNFMINRYGPWMETNLVIPLEPQKSKLICDYYLEPSLKNDREFIERSIKTSDLVLREDILQCESIQRGLASRGFCTGPYSSAEEPMHHFHCFLHEILSSKMAS